MTDNENRKNQHANETSGAKRAPARRTSAVKKNAETAQKVPVKKQVKPAQTAVSKTNAKNAPKAQGAKPANKPAVKAAKPQSNARKAKPAPKAKGMQAPWMENTNAPQARCGRRAASQAREDRQDAPH